jgi:hypothetical protein
MSKRPTIRSKQPCPECGGREWYPLDGLYEEEMRDANKPEQCEPVIDERYGSGFYDACANPRCGIVVV